MKSYGVTIQMKATEQYFPMVLFIMLYKVVLTFESADEILRYDHTFSVEHFFGLIFTLTTHSGNERVTREPLFGASINGIRGKQTAV